MGRSTISYFLGIVTGAGGVEGCGIYGVEADLQDYGQEFL